VWIVGGVLLVTANWYVWDRFQFWFPNERTQEVFLYIGPSPELQARQAFRRRLVLAGKCLEGVTVVYASVGAVLLHRRGFGFIGIPVAVAIVFLTILAVWDIDLR
jgi:hypothetical protein